MRGEERRERRDNKQPGTDLQITKSDVTSIRKEADRTEHGELRK
jgi:hypothetical protein